MVTITTAGLIGLFVGSFLNVVIYRAPLGLSVAAPRSFCPTCDRQLLWWENVPVASWVALRGRCRTCHQPISVRYPLVELVTAAVFSLTTWAWHGTVFAAAFCALAASLIAVALIEFGGQRAPLAVAAVGTGVALLIIVIGSGWHHRWGVVIGSLVGTAGALGAYALPRVQDPGRLDPRAHGRSALLLAGCWFGSLGLRAMAIGGVLLIASYFLCMVGVWGQARQDVGVSGSSSTPMLVRTVNPVFGAPLITAIAIGMAVSLIVGA